jgi:hypothetical protein
VSRLASNLLRAASHWRFLAEHDDEDVHVLPLTHTEARRLRAFLHAHTSPSDTGSALRRIYNRLEEMCGSKT